MMNFTVGPVMMQEEILEIGARQLPYFRTDSFSRLMLENETLMLKAIEAEEKSRIVFLTASGTGAMEASILNFFTEKDKLLVVNGGSFGTRFKEICDIHGIPADAIVLKHGCRLKKENLSDYDQKGYTGFLVNAHETSTGVLYDMELIADFCKKNNLFLVVDAISTFLADPFHMEKWGVNAAIISSQKALAIPAGMSFVVVDEKAQMRAAEVNFKQMYFNFNTYLADGRRGQTPFTPAVSVLHQLNKRMKMVMAQGVKYECEKTAKIAEQFRCGIKDLPFEISSENCSNALTPIHIKGKKSATELIQYLIDKYDIYVNPCSGDEKETHMRVGHIGDISQEQIETLLAIFHEMDRKGEL